MARLDHISLLARDWRASRDWWRDNLGFAVEFELPGGAGVAMADESDLTVFFTDGEPAPPDWLSFTVQVDDVEARCAALAARGAAFVHPPQAVFWGYGAELKDPDGYRLRLWDKASMAAKGGG